MQSRVELFDLRGKPSGEVRLPEPGSALGLSGKTTGRDFFFEFTSYLRPRTVYASISRLERWSLSSLRCRPLTPRNTRRALSSIRRKDGTRVPIFVTARKGIALDHSHPTMLYA